MKALKKQNLQRTHLLCVKAQLLYSKPINILILEIISLQNMFSINADSKKCLRDLFD